MRRVWVATVAAYALTAGLVSAAAGYAGARHEWGLMSVFTALAATAWGFTCGCAWSAGKHNA